MWLRKFIEKCGLFFMTPKAYSTIFSCAAEVFSSHGISNTPDGQLRIHSPQPVHFFSSKMIVLFSRRSAWPPHHLTHWPQPMHRFTSTRGVSLSCMAYFPARVPQPMPMFLSAPPKPEISWPLKCDMNTSESE